MDASAPASVCAVIEVSQDGSCWRLRSSDRLFSGVFTDLRSARRHAHAEAESHPGHTVIVRDDETA